MTFTFDQSRLGAFGALYDEQTLEDRGRGISIEWVNDEGGKTVTLFGYAVRYALAETEPRETP